MKFDKLREEINPTPKTEVEETQLCMELLSEANSYNLRPEMIKLKDRLHEIFPNVNMLKIYEAALKIVFILKGIS